jgi:hypothetical protein
VKLDLDAQCVCARILRFSLPYNPVPVTPSLHTPTTASLWRLVSNHMQLLASSARRGGAQNAIGLVDSRIEAHKRRIAPKPVLFAAHPPTPATPTLPSSAKRPQHSRVSLVSPSAPGGESWPRGSWRETMVAGANIKGAMSEVKKSVFLCTHQQARPGARRREQRRRHGKEAVCQIRPKNAFE